MIFLHNLVTIMLSLSLGKSIAVAIEKTWFPESTSKGEG